MFLQMLFLRLFAISKFASQKNDVFVSVGAYVPYKYLVLVLYHLYVQSSQQQRHKKDMPTRVHCLSVCGRHHGQTLTDSLLITHIISHLEK